MEDTLSLGSYYHNQRLVLITRSVYGKLLVYPVNDPAKAICKLIRKQTLDSNDILNLQSLGYTITYETLKPDYK